MTYQGRARSNAWFLLPIFLGIIGGVIAFFVLRKDDPKKAMNCLILGLIFMAIGIIFNLLAGDVVMDLQPGVNVNT